MPSELVDTDKNTLTFYVLKTKDNEQLAKEYFPYFSGIGVDKNINSILYYYIQPAD